MMSIFLLVLFFILMFLGIPIATSLGISVVASVLLFTDVPLSLVIQTMFSSMNSFLLVSVPLFILAGLIMEEGGVADRLFGFAQSLVGWMTGGLGHVNVIASLIFAGMAGSSVADIAGTGRMQINAMVKKGYPLSYSAALTLITAMLASIIPPSILMIVAASTAGVSIGAALMGGLVPGIIISIIFMIFNHYYSKKHNYGIREKFDWNYFKRETITSLPALLAPVVLLAGILSGIFTPTEAAAICVLYTLIISVFIYRKLSFKRLPSLMLKTANMSGTILFIAVTAKAASWVFEYDGLPSRIANVIGGISESPIIIMLVLFVFLLIVGMFMDATAAIFILVPILMPAILAVGIDPVYFVVFMVVALSFGLVTPPVGVCLYATSNITGLSIERLSKDSMPWFGVTMIALLVLIFIPQIITVPLTWFDL